MKPAVMRMMRQARDLSCSSTAAMGTADTRIRDLAASCRLLQDFLEEIERYGQDGA